MTMFRSGALAAFSLLTLTACADGLELAPPLGSSGTTTSQSGSVSSGNSSTLTVADQSFVAQAAYGGFGEVALGKLAQNQASSSAVRSLGQQIVTDHTRANQELAQIAQAKGMTPPTVPDPGRQAVAEAMMSLQGANFDRQYLQQQLADHEVSIALFQAQARGGTDPDLRAFASKWLPGLQMHARDIRTLSGSMARVTQ
jgi:putative membrane protein